MLKTNILIFSIISIFAVLFIFSCRVDSSQESDFCLKKSYHLYKKNFMSMDGRIMDPDRDNITTSEGQSYMLLRCIVMGDKKTFDLVYKWTKNNLQREDRLFAWLWGKNQSGEYKILDDNTASDADADIALALILAYEKWGNSHYLEDAKPIINSIWNNETKRVGDYLILMPGVKQALSEKIEVNPSYFTPNAYRYFQKYDELHDWNCMIDSSYYYLGAAMSKTSTGLPPNWFLIKQIQNGVQDNEEGVVQNDRQKRGQIILEKSERSDFSYDAVRVFARVYFDYVRNGEERALPILEKSNFFIDQWKKDKTFYVNYQANGHLRNKDKFVGAMSILIPVISMYDPKIASEMYEKEAGPSLRNKQYWEGKQDYYGKNLAWYGCYMYKKDSIEYKEMEKSHINASQ